MAFYGKSSKVFVFQQQVLAFHLMVFLCTVSLPDFVINSCCLSTVCEKKKKKTWKEEKLISHSYADLNRIVSYQKFCWTSVDLRAFLVFRCFTIFDCVVYIAETQNTIGHFLQPEANKSKSSILNKSVQNKQSKYYFVLFHVLIVRKGVCRTSKIQKENGKLNLHKPEYSTQMI